MQSQHVLIAFSCHLLFGVAIAIMFG